MRPDCAICGGGVSSNFVSDGDVQEEREYAQTRGKKMRPWYCSPTCFAISRDHQCTKPRCKDDWCGVNRWKAGERSKSAIKSEVAAKAIAGKRQKAISRRDSVTESDETLIGVAR